MRTAAMRQQYIHFGRVLAPPESMQQSDNLYMWRLDAMLCAVESHHIMYLAKDLIDLADLRLVLQEDGGIEIWDLHASAHCSA